MPPGDLSSPADDIVSGMGFWAGVEAGGEEDIVPAGEVGEIEGPTANYGSEVFVGSFRRCAS